MSSPSRFDSGVTNRGIRHPMASLSILDPTKHQVFFEDFHGFTVAAANITGWHQDADGSPTNAAIQDAIGGVMLMKPGGTASNNVQYQWGTNTTVHEPFFVQAGKKAWLRTRFKIEDADQNLIEIGLHIAADDPWATEPSDQFLFRTLAADADAIQFACGKTNSTEVTVALGDLADDTWVTLTAHYDGKNTVTCWRESDAGSITHVGSGTVTSATAGDLLPDTEMTMAFGDEAVDTGADDFSIDFILFVCER